MSRDIFIKKISYFNEEQDAINKNQYMKEDAEEQMKAYQYKSKKQYVEKQDLPRCWINLIDVERLKNITLKKDNPFIYFYELNDDKLNQLFEIINKTELGIYYFDRYVEPTKDYIKMNNKNENSRVNKLEETIKIIYEFDSEVKKYFKNDTDTQQEPKGLLSIRYLDGLIQSFKNEHYTIRQLFSNLLYEIHNLLIDEKYKDKKISEQKKIDIINEIIKLYFDKDITFTKATNINLFKTKKYFYETMQPIILTHN